MADDEVWIEVEDDGTVDLSIADLARTMGEEETRAFLEAQGMDPDEMMDAFGVESLDELELAGFTGQAETRMSSQAFSSIHLQTAAELSDQVRGIEESRDNQQDGKGWGHHMNWSLAISSITSCMSFLDAIINEFIDDVTGANVPFHADTPDDIEDAGFNSQFRTRLERFEGDFINWRHTSTLEKYQVILYVADKEPLDRGTNPYQDADTVRRLRNYFVHYTPEMFEHDQDEIQHDIGSALQGKFDLNPLVDDSKPYFPHKILSYGCTEWCIDTALNFTDHYFDRLGLVPAYRRTDSFFFGDRY